MQLTGKNYLGKTTSAQGTSQFRAIDPAKNIEIEPAFIEATAAETSAAMKLSEAAFIEYRRRSPKQRAEFLKAIATEIEGLGDELVQRMSTESALPAGRIGVELARTTGQLRMFAAMLEEGSWVDARIDRADPNRKGAPKPDLRRMLIPLGPVVVFGASNFPLAFSTAGGDTASALAAGCTVVVKGHPSHPGTSEIVFNAVLRAAQSTGMPDGVVSLVQGRDPQVSLALVNHPLTKAVGFTGSLKGGRALFDAAAARPEPIPFYGEMGSTNPVFILPRAMKERGSQIAEGLKNSVIAAVGQFCTNPGITIGLGDEAMRGFVAQLSELIVAAPVGTMLNPGIGKAFGEGRQRLAATPGVKVAAQSSAATSLPTQAAPVVFATGVKEFLANHALREELFGPSTIVVTAQTPAEFEQIATRLDGQLTATIHAADGELDEHRGLVEILLRKVGRLIVNGYPTGVEVNASMQHGGPYPATTDSRSTSVGSAAIERFVRPVCYQDFPAEALPPELVDANPLHIWRLVDGKLGRE